MDDVATPGLRERRRRATTLDIRRAALDLVEVDGWDATTVSDIAARAGISSRTFFRYFDSKEQAVLPAHRRVWEALDDFAPSSVEPAAVVRDLWTLLRSTALDNDADDLEVHNRIARLFQSNPQLHAVAAVHEAAYAQRIHEQLAAALPEEDSLRLRTLAEQLMAMWRTAWWHWGAQLTARTAASPDDSFDAVERAVREHPISL